MAEFYKEGIKKMLDGLSESYLCFIYTYMMKLGMGAQK